MQESVLPVNRKSQRCIQRQCPSSSPNRQAPLFYCRLDQGQRGHKTQRHCPRRVGPAGPCFIPRASNQQHPHRQRSRHQSHSTGWQCRVIGDPGENTGTASTCHTSHGKQAAGTVVNPTSPLRVAIAQTTGMPPAIASSAGNASPVTSPIRAPVQANVVTNASTGHGVVVASFASSPASTVVEGGGSQSPEPMNINYAARLPASVASPEMKLPADPGSVRSPGSMPVPPQLLALSPRNEGESRSLPEPRRKMSADSR